MEGAPCTRQHAYHHRPNQHEHWHAYTSERWPAQRNGRASARGISFGVSKIGSLNGGENDQCAQRVAKEVDGIEPMRAY